MSALALALVLAPAPAPAADACAPDPDGRHFDGVAYGRPQPGFNGLSTAVIADGALWLGSFQAERLAVVRDWQPSGATP